MISAYPTVSHWIEKAPQPSGRGPTDALGLPAAGGRPSQGGKHAAAAQELASQKAVFVSMAVSRSPGRHRKPAQPGQPGQPSQPDQASSGPSGRYMNPLRGISGLVPQRIDQGVDFFGSGPIYAIGNAVITNASSNSGWPGGGWITYQLTDGPDAGLMVYVAEDVTPDVQVGEHVSSSTVIANMFSGSAGIETGWADPQGVGSLSDLAEAGGIGAGGPFPTRVGVSFDDLLVSLGVPAAPNLGQSPSGLLPPGYPG
jgi:murein DD-endopeptidase MepM/ murein hydrolase activator NlpD